MQEHYYSKRDDKYTFLCDTCPLNAYGQYDAAVGAGRVEEAENNNRKIGKAKTGLGIGINACRLARAHGDCSDPQALTGMSDEMLTKTRGGRPIPNSSREYYEYRVGIYYPQDRISR